MNTNIIIKNPLFKNLDEASLDILLKSASAFTKIVKKNSEIYSVGDKGKPLGIVLSGKICIENIDFLGNRSIIDVLDEGKVFAETYASLPSEPMMVSVSALTDTEILFLNIYDIVCKPHPNEIELTFIRNLYSISLKKNLHLSKRNLHTASKTIRGKLIAYLSTQETMNGSNEFDIPMDRQQLADYLNVDRSAMSAELSKMKADELISFHKNHFKLNSSLLS